MKFKCLTKYTIFKIKNRQENIRKNVYKKWWWQKQEKEKLWHCSCCINVFSSFFWVSNKNAAFYYFQVLFVFCREPVLIVTFFSFHWERYIYSCISTFGSNREEKDIKKILKSLGKIKAHFYYAYLYRKRKYFILF